MNSQPQMQTRSQGPVQTHGWGLVGSPWAGGLEKVRGGGVSFSPKAPLQGGGAEVLLSFTSKLFLVFSFLSSWTHPSSLVHPSW